MSRRLSPFQLIFAFVVVVLWGLLLTNKSTRDLTRRHLHNSVFPPLRTMSYNDTLNNSRAEDRLIRASFRNQPVLPLLEQFPDDVSLLAAYVRRSDALPCHRRLGPLFSGYIAWSVQISAAGFPGVSGPIPTAIEEDISSRPPAKETANVLRLIERGKTLEPQNTFWDWMEMSALLAAGREQELPHIVERAALKHEWDDHVMALTQATAIWNQRERMWFAPGAKIEPLTSVLLFHVVLLRSIVRSVAQQMMGLRLQGRDKEALQLGLQTIRLTRLIRLNANLPITSSVAVSCERIIIREARVPLGLRTPLPFPSPASALAKDQGSLLFLAKQLSPTAAREISTEWIRLNGWETNSETDLLGRLVPRDSIERVGWTTRATSFLVMTLPVALVVWLLLFAVGKRWNIETNASAPWGSVAGGLLLTGFLAFDWITRNNELQRNLPGSFCDVNCIAPQELLFPVRSFLEAHGLVWSGVTLLLGMFAFYIAFAPYRIKQDRVTRPAEMTHPIDFLWGGVKFIWRKQGRLWSFLAPLLVLALALTPAIGLASLGRPENFGWDIVGISLALAIWPVSVSIRQLVIFLRTRQRTEAPARFIGVWCSSIGNFLAVASLILPVLIWSQSRFESDFNRQFAPIEQGKMIAAMQKMRGVPMQ